MTSLDSVELCHKDNKRNNNNNKIKNINKLSNTNTNNARYRGNL